MIGNTTIYIAGVGESTVRLAIEADRKMPIVREEAVDPGEDQADPHDHALQSTPGGE